MPFGLRLKTILERCHLIHGRRGSAVSFADGSDRRLLKGRAGTLICAIIGNCPASAHPPVVTTSDVSWVRNSGTALAGTVNRNGFATTAWFEYGTDTSYGSTLPITFQDQFLTVTQAVGATFPAPKSGTTYHFRLGATNDNGTTYSEDRVFTIGLTAGDWIYATAGPNTHTITRYKGPGGAVHIPGSVNGSAVSYVGGNAFYGINTVTGVTVPPEINSVGTYAFFNCTALEAVELPAGLTNLGDNCFCNCQSLKRISLPSGLTHIPPLGFWGCANLVNADLPHGVTTIRTSAFSGCSKLTRITLPGTLSTIYQFAFSGCGAMSKVRFSNGLKNIGDNAFTGCGSLPRAAFPSSLTTLSNNAFSSCGQLSAAVFSGNAPTPTTSLPFPNAAPGFTVYFVNGSSGFTTPTWHGYPCVGLGRLQAWRVACFGTQTPSGNAADSADPDNDGQSNLTEYTAGTDPADGTDSFRILSGAMANGAYQVVIPGKVNRLYVLERSANPNGPWNTVATTGPAAADAPLAISDATPLQGRAFHRVKAEFP